MELLDEEHTGADQEFLLERRDSSFSKQSKRSIHDSETVSAQDDMSFRRVQTQLLILPYSDRFFEGNLPQFKEALEQKL